jgi:Asp-tRNA(Asn)/Glu-tRNA(Gln) amidotransferase B subunit
VKGELERSFELKKIREAVRGVFNKEVKHDVFLERMRVILNDPQTLRNREMLADYFRKADKGTDMLFDKMHFLKKENWIIEQVEDQQRALREVEVTIDEADAGIERILPQTLAYLQRCA